MTKKTKFKPFLEVILAIIVFVAVISIALVCINIGQDFAFFGFRTIHSPAYVHAGHSASVFAGNDNNYYCVSENGYDLIKNMPLLKNRNYSAVSFNHGNTKIGLKKVYFDDDYVVVIGITDSGLNDGSKNYTFNRYFQIYDSSFKLVYETESTEYSISDCMIFGSVVYCLCYYNSIDKIELAKYDILNEEFATINKDVAYDCLYNYDGFVFEIGHDAVFTNHETRGKKELSHWIDNTDNKSIEHKYCYGVDLSINNNEFILWYQGLEYSFKTNHVFNKFYSKSYLVDNKIVFAVRNHVNKKSCGGYSNQCLCGYEESYLFSIDLLSKELCLINAYKPRTFLVDYDLEGASYYCDGNLFVKDVLSQECTKIEPGKPKTVFGDVSVKDNYDYYFFYDNGVFYGVQ